MSKIIKITKQGLTLFFRDSITAKENFDLLYKGLPTTYKTFEGPIFSQKLSSKSKK